MRRPFVALIFTLTLALALALVLANGRGAWAAPLDEPIQPVPLAHRQDPVRAELGQRLFQDTRLSGNNSVSCASCHNVAKGGADGRGRSVGFSGQRTGVNAPTVLNAALNFRQFWNGRAGSLEAQIDAVIQNPVEMGSAWRDVVAMVSRDARYKAAFDAAYKDGVTKANIQNAIATYERTLTTPGSRFDGYLRGERNAMTGQELAGYAKFKRYGCVACHQGVNVGGNMFQKFGVMGDYFAKRGQPTQADLGRYLVTGDLGDRHVFKVPSLRNVALTAPYFHDGSARTLEEAVDVMFKYQLGRTASKEDTADIVKFLHTLTGQVGELPK
ncbi:cytochrome c peroxidase [Ramlibacter sp.]|uniref:cytochrome-c peroxidase n=1 Tax=Ramlibacter sp. TaxID=1917967 RepID=UPI00184A1628|nr:cytochrome c peroxidase [Ramlibacter sp.]MBA2675489.1 c-type cytochrome [Ramlibacter sp.]